MSSMGNMPGRQKMAFATRVNEGSPESPSNSFSYSEGAISLGTTASAVFPSKSPMYSSTPGSDITSPHRRGVPDVNASRSPATPTGMGNNHPVQASNGEAKQMFPVPDHRKLKPL